MSGLSPESKTASWQDEIRRREEEARAAFLQADIGMLDTLFADDFAVNSPLQKVLSKQQLLDALRAGRIRHLEFEVEIERIDRHGDVVVVMGHDRVVDPPDSAVSHRRFTNVWRWDAGAWRSIARHAHVVSREVPANEPRNG